MRLDEAAKYEKCYTIRNYRMGKRNRQRALKDIRSIPKHSTYLDVGCGRGEAVTMAIEHGLVAHGIEIVPSLCNGVTILHAEICDIPFENIQYVSCYDVLEHLPPDDIDGALDELWRVAEQSIFITTNNRQSRLFDKDLHLTRQPRAWWSNQFSRRGFRVTEHRTYATESDWHWRIDL